MTNRELIQELLDYPMDSKVVVISNRDATLGICEADKSTIHVLTLSGYSPHAKPDLLNIPRYED